MWWFQLLPPLLLLTQRSNGAVEWFHEKLHHASAAVTNEEFIFLSNLSNEADFNQTLSKIAIPRQMGTRGHEAVKNFIVTSMKGVKWDVELDAFSQDTVIGHVTFENIIATLDPTAHRHLVLACHYDSKMDREKALVLATDSAVPCSMMIQLAQLLDPFLQLSRTQKSKVTLRFIFFDGEEAFRDWTNTDSIYGARHLAHLLGSTPYPQANQQSTNHLNRMDVMVLLDLLGYKNPTFRNFFTETSDLYTQLQKIETKLNELSLIRTSSNQYFTNDLAWQGIEDDHMPFLHRGVRILHLIAVPFPRVWHTEADTVSNLDFVSIDNLNKMLRVFVASYLRLNVSSVAVGGRQGMAGGG